MGRILQFPETHPSFIGVQLEQRGASPRVHEMIVYCEDREGRSLLEPLIFEPNAQVANKTFTLEDAMKFCTGLLTLPGYRFETSTAYEHDCSDEEGKEDTEVLTFVLFAHRIPDAEDDRPETKWTAILTFAASGYAPRNYGDTLFKHTPNR